MQTRHIRKKMSIVTGALIFLIFSVSLALGQSDDPNTRIVGGKAAGSGQFPHQVSLRMGDSHFCGGSIVSSTRILTAAHCLDGYDSINISAHVGTLNRLSSGQKYRTYLNRIHPNWNPRTLINDIATLDTDRTISFNDYVQPIRLASAEPGPGTSVYASGWGLLQYQGSSPDRLQYLALTILDNISCAAFLQSYGVINNGHVCTTSPSGQGMCYGDSGGPLTDGYQQVGVVSWGAPCAKGLPDVFTSVASYRNWILQ